MGTRAHEGEFCEGAKDVSIMAAARALAPGAVLMSAAGEDPGWSWVAVASGFSAIFSFLFGLVVRGWSTARASGEDSGGMRVWKAMMEERAAGAARDLSAVREAMTQAAAVAQATAREAAAATEARLGLRLSSLETRTDRVDEKISKVPTRDEVDKRFDRIDDRLGELSNYLHDKETRPGARGM